MILKSHKDKIKKAVITLFESYRSDTGTQRKLAAIARSVKETACKLLRCSVFYSVHDTCSWRKVTITAHMFVTWPPAQSSFIRHRPSL